MRNECAGDQKPWSRTFPHPWGPFLSRGRDDLTRWPGVAGRGWGGAWCCGFPRSCRLCRRAVGVQLERPEPRSGEDERAGCRQAAADHRERGRACCWGWRMGKGAGCLPGGWWSSEWSHVHPFGACLVAGAMTVPSGGPGCSVTSSSAADAGSCDIASSPGAWRPLPVCYHVPGEGRAGCAGCGAAWASISRW
jgi:hypothetical protein